MMSATAREGMEELMALSVPPLKKVCAFKSMTSFGSHYRVELEEAGGSHVTFDTGVAEVVAHTVPPNSSEDAARVELVRVGMLKDIWVLNYENLNIVLMVVSWVAKHTEMQPRIVVIRMGFGWPTWQPDHATPQTLTYFRRWPPKYIPHASADVCFVFWF